MKPNEDIDLNDFDFLAEPLDKPIQEPDQPLVPVVVTRGPNLSQVAKMTSRKFAQSVLDVYDALGKDTWLLTQAKIDPKGFLELLKRMIPKSITAEDLGGLSITLIDQFGNKVQISNEETRGPGPRSPASDAASAPGGGPAQLGQPETATGGNPQSPDVTIKDTF